ncbi:TerD family protein [Deinococcus depolymerans]|uniref:TerD family protein n=1 Tax=Deinococcus depolymerans TaxID=392408 RepID=A0ABP3LWI4_9DEIO
MSAPIPEHLQRGQRIPLAALTAQRSLTVQVNLPGMNEADLSLFGINEQRRLADDRYFIFYNQLSSPERALSLDLRRSEFHIHLDRLPPSIHRLTVAATSDNQTFAALGAGEVHLSDPAGVKATFKVQGNVFQAEKAVLLLDFYRYQGEWRVAAVGQGFNGGLQALLESMGGEVVNDPPTPPGLPVPPQSSSPLPIQQWPALKSVPLFPPTGTTCRRCQVRSNLLNRLDTQGICGRCQREVAEGLRQFRLRFVDACADSVMEYSEWQDLQAVIDRERLSAHRALEFVRSDALRFLERMFALARADGQITQEEETTFNWMVKHLEVPTTMVSHLQRELEELKQAAQLRAGNLPAIRSSIMLEAGEIAHLECTATYRHVTSTRTRDIPGKLVVTNRQVHFLSPTEGGWNIQYAKVLQIEELPDGVNLALGVKKGNGYYHEVRQPVLLGATLDALVRINKRLLMMPQTERASRSIPQKVKLEVWQRDQGKCVECGDSNYLEFDHVIPHSKGGASTVNNLQLLCRRCNLQKSNRL